MSFRPHCCPCLLAGELSEATARFRQEMGIYFYASRSTSKVGSCPDRRPERPAVVPARTWISSALVFALEWTRKGTKLSGRFWTVRRELSGTCTDQWWVQLCSLLSLKTTKPGFSTAVTDLKQHISVILSHLKVGLASRDVFCMRCAFYLFLPAAELLNRLNPRMWIWPAHKCHIDNCHNTSASVLLSRLIIHTCSALAISFPHRLEAPSKSLPPAKLEKSFNLCVLGAAESIFIQMLLFPAWLLLFSWTPPLL